MFEKVGLVEWKELKLTADFCLKDKKIQNTYINLNAINPEIFYNLVWIKSTFKIKYLLKQMNYISYIIKNIFSYKRTDWW